MLDLVKTNEELRRFIQINAKSLRLLRKHLGQLAHTLGEKKKYESHLAKLQGLQTKAKNRLRRPTGAGLGRTNDKMSDRVQWVDVKSAFQSRIRTAAVVNLTHKFPETFLRDAMVLVKRRFRRLLKIGVNFKANFELSCKFKLERTDEIEDKFFQTGNVLLSLASNLDEILDDCCRTIQTKVRFRTFIE